MRNTEYDAFLQKFIAIAHIFILVILAGLMTPQLYQ